MSACPVDWDVHKLTAVFWSGQSEMSWPRTQVVPPALHPRRAILEMEPKSPRPTATTPVPVEMGSTLFAAIYTPITPYFSAIQTVSLIKHGISL